MTNRPGERHPTSMLVYDLKRVKGKCGIVRCPNDAEDYLVICIPQPGGNVTGFETDQKICKWHQDPNNIDPQKIVTEIGWAFLCKLLKDMGLFVPPKKSIYMQYTRKPDKMVGEMNWKFGNDSYK